MLEKTLQALKRLIKGKLNNSVWLILAKGQKETGPEQKSPSAYPDSWPQVTLWAVIHCSTETEFQGLIVWTDGEIYSVKYCHSYLRQTSPAFPRQLGSSCLQAEFCWACLEAQGWISTARTPKLPGRRSVVKLYFCGLNVFWASLLINSL